jgi:hypothetical protein
MFYGVELAFSSQINTKHIDTLFAECQFSIFKPGDARNQ